MCHGFISCKHFYCADCWKNYIMSNVSSSNTSLLPEFFFSEKFYITYVFVFQNPHPPPLQIESEQDWLVACPAYQCQTILHEEFILQMAPRIRQSYLTIQVNSFITVCFPTLEPITLKSLVLELVLVQILPGN